MFSINKNFTLACLPAALWAALVAPAAAQSGVYRCGNEYTNSAIRIERGGCTPLTGGNVTVVRASAMRTSLTQRPSVSSRPSGKAASGGAGTSASSGDSTKAVDSATQRTRDTGSRNILQTELDKATQHLAELKKEFNNGEPEKIGPEHRNYQKYLDRVASLKSSIARTESDIQGIKRELGRTGG